MGRAYKNPTEDMALGHIMLEEKRKRRREMRRQNRSPGAHSRTQCNGRHRTSVWRDDGANASAVPVEVNIVEGK